MGLIYEARHVSLGRSFALKLIRHSFSADTVFVSRFRIEGAALGRLKHPNIVDVTDFGVDARDSGVPYLVMELLRGSSLAERLRREGSLELSEAIPIFRSWRGPSISRTSTGFSIEISSRPMSSSLQKRRRSKP